MGRITNTQANEFRNNHKRSFVAPKGFKALVPSTFHGSTPSEIQETILQRTARSRTVERLRLHFVLFFHLIVEFDIQERWLQRLPFLS